VIGTVVPTPGGATHALDGLQVTSVEAAQRTWEIHQEIFAKSPAAAAWSRVLALVVQPGVEFGHDSVVEYDRAKARELSQWVHGGQGPLTFEAHSTDYQLPAAYPTLVEDGFGILKVGPALTFAMREALYALEAMEKVLVDAPQCSHLAETIERRMLEEPKDWASHYPGDAREQKLLRHYSYSDRVRYYWTKADVAASVATLLRNLGAAPIAETLLSQYMPVPYARVRAGVLRDEPLLLILDQVRDVLRLYAAACRPASIA
jgi:D-tagatose-1,6-bisphosphate aldolase subunit GatZ/KbaZ